MGRVEKLLRTGRPKPGSQFRPESGGAGGGGGASRGEGGAAPRLPPDEPADPFEYYMFFFAWSLIAQKVRRAEAAWGRGGAAQGS